MTKRQNVQALRPKVYHRGVLINAHGNVSALCFARPRAIDLGSAMWTNRDEAVTCPKCRRLIKARCNAPTETA